MSTSIAKKIAQNTRHTCLLVRKNLHLAFHQGKQQSTPLFVFGLGRGGTTMILNILSLSLDTSIHQEGTKKAFNRYRLKDTTELRGLIDKCRQKVVVFKPLQDSQHALQILDQIPRSKAVWIYRHFNDQINSTLKSWGDWEGGRRDLDLLWKRKGRFSERISEETYAFFKEHYHSECRLEDAVCLMWYIRHILYFELNLTDDVRFRLLNYEKLVTSPQEHFKNLFDFSGCEYRHEYVSSIFNTSVVKHPKPIISGPIKSHCERLFKRFQSEPHL